jgi:hypothetical protein
MDLESLISLTSRSPQMDEHQTGSCSRIWHVGFCFDGISRNIQQDASETRLSNISRLFRTCPGVLKNKITKICSNFISPVPAHRAQNA